MEDFKKELALLLEAHGVAICAMVHHYGDNKTAGMVEFQSFDGKEAFNTRRCHVTSHDLDHTLQQSPMGKQVKGLS
ncbi:hypothetical protein NVP1084O_106 [Vibrio phage 1.084.O._10N.261.49.F5]|nr:hypothetical protein NVP1084O_106 [Vibrio phage 1.084.O._10N.261.49.F5]